MKKRLTVQEHIVLAARLKQVRNELMRFLIADIAPAFPLNSKVVTVADRTWRSVDALRSELDTEYHKVATPEEFAEHGNIYYD